MARRNFGIELDERIKASSVAALVKRPADPTELLVAAGHVQGLNAAKLLFEEIVRSNVTDDDTE